MIDKFYKFKSWWLINFTNLNLDISQSVDLRIVNSPFFVELLIFLQLGYTDGTRDAVLHP